MTTTYRLKEDAKTGELVEVSPWKRPEFQSFTAIILGSALIMSLIGAFKLATDVNVATKTDAPSISTRAEEATGTYVY